MNILYVEDCEISIALLQYLMQKYGEFGKFSLDVAVTVTDAIQMLSVEKHGAALIDWNLPDGEGIEVAEHIRSVNKALPIIFLSAVWTDDQLSAAESYHPKACLAKGHGKLYIENILQLISMD